MSSYAGRVRVPWPLRRETVLVGLGLLVIYVVWGSVYVAIRYVVEDVPSLLSIGLRYIVAGSMLASYVAARHGAGMLRAPRHAVLGCVGLALLLQVLTNGTTTWAEGAGVQAGPAALLTALAPIGIIFLRLGSGDRPRAVTWVGVVVGFAGLAVLLLGGRSVPGFPLGPSLLIVASAGCWAVGSFLQPRLQLPSHTFVTTAYQLLAGGVVLTVAGLVGGERTSFHFPAETWLVLGYLTLSSVVSYTTYVWLLARAPISLVSTHAYVNPVVAVLLGWAWLGEPITWPVLVGGAVVLVAVGLIMAERRRLPEEPPVT
ncbi:MAG TPA: EamA family transporter [Nocardioides sp.]|jgi:drug/metabolite transporter (DMT)-like permease|nr:EamA family transporter [Nocardioides sp.]